MPARAVPARRAARGARRAHGLRSHLVRVAELVIVLAVLTTIILLLRRLALAALLLRLLAAFLLRLLPLALAVLVVLVLRHPRLAFEPARRSSWIVTRFWFWYREREQYELSRCQKRGPGLQRSLQASPEKRVSRRPDPLVAGSPASGRGQAEGDGAARRD